MALEKVLVYTPNPGCACSKALEKVISILLNPSKVVVSHELEQELKKGNYGLIIDTTPVMPESHNESLVASCIKQLQLDEIPKVECIYNPATAVTDICKLVGSYFAPQQ